MSTARCWPAGSIHPCERSRSLQSSHNPGVALSGPDRGFSRPKFVAFCGPDCGLTWPEPWPYLAQTVALPGPDRGFLRSALWAYPARLVAFLGAVRGFIWPSFRGKIGSPLVFSLSLSHFMLLYSPGILAFFPPVSFEI